MPPPVRVAAGLRPSAASPRPVVSLAPRLRHCRRAGPVPSLRPGGRRLASSSPRSGPHPSPASSVTRCLLLAAYMLRRPNRLPHVWQSTAEAAWGPPFQVCVRVLRSAAADGLGSCVAAASRTPSACSARPSSDHGSRETMCRPCGLCRAQNHAYQPPAAPLSCAVFLVTTGRNVGHTLVTLYFILHQVRKRRSTSPSHGR